MLILADLSGIQDYLFEVRETGGKQAKLLRFRSLYIQLIAEAVGVRLLRAAGLTDDRLIFSAAGKIAVDGTGISQARLDALHQEVREVELWLRDKTHARLRLSVTIHDRPGMTIRERFDAAGCDLRKAKLRGWSAVAGPSTGWRSSALRVTSPPNDDAEAARDAELGRRVVQAGIRHVVLARAGSGGFDAAGLGMDFVANPPSKDGGLAVRDMTRLARHVPVDPSGSPIEFVDLAEGSRGAAMLGVLKADADSLGTAIERCLAGAGDLQPLKALSERLETFFASGLDQQMSLPGSRWTSLYTVFSGGDDLLLVGPWDLVLDFAGHLQHQFTQQFKSDHLTISTGVAIIKPKFPIRLAARQADDLLDEAKSKIAPRAGNPKDQCAALGGLWKWSDHDRIIKAGKQLAGWVDADAVERGWLHTLLQLSLLRRGELPGPGAPQHEQVMAAARLSYHVARNWPKGDDTNPSKRDARAWINGILREFDRFDTTMQTETIHLPAIIRYAMLATRHTMMEI